MATRIPTRNITLKLTGVSPAIDPSKLEEIMKAAIEELTPRAPRKRADLRNRNVRKAQTYPCRREPSPLWAAAIIWPAGVPHKGCGRVYTTEKTRDRHEAGASWNPVRFPHGCLDAIVPADLRDGR